MCAMYMQDCVLRNLEFIDRYLAGECKPTHDIEDLDTHRSLLFPEYLPSAGTRISVREEKTGRVHGVGFDLLKYADIPQDVLPLEALLFDPDKKRATIGAGYIRHLSANSVQIGFLEAMTFDLQDDSWVKSGHEKMPKPDHPLIDSAMASWKFNAHMKDTN